MLEAEITVDLAEDADQALNRLGLAGVVEALRHRVAREADGVVDVALDGLGALTLSRDQGYSDISNPIPVGRFQELEFVDHVVHG